MELFDFIEQDLNKTIIIFANSVKHQQHCIAGKCINTGKWVRPVSTDNGGALSQQQIQYTNKYGRYTTKRLQKINMEFIKPVPLVNQPENFLISSKQWEQRYSIKDNEIVQWLDSPVSLWGAGGNISYLDIQLGNIKIDQSLYLVEVENFRVFNRRGSFIYNQQEYDLPITDPLFDNYLNLGENCRIFLCISLGEPYKGSCYKIIAGIFKL